MKNKILMMACVGVLAALPVFAKTQESLIVRNNAIVVCRGKQCKSARDTMTSEFLYNKLGSLLKNNVNQKMLLCDADPNVHVCLNNALVFKARAGATVTTVQIPSALVIDSKSLPDQMAQQFVLDYTIKVGGTYPICQASLNQMQIISADEINIETPGFECRFTENGATLLNASYGERLPCVDVQGQPYGSGILHCKNCKLLRVLLRLSDHAACCGISYAHDKQTLGHKRALLEIY